MSRRKPVAASDDNAHTREAKRARFRVVRDDGVVLAGSASRDVCERIAAVIGEHAKVEGRS